MINKEQAVKTIFLLVFFLIYGGIHLYLFLGAKASLAPGARASIFIALFMVIMVLAPIIVHMAERSGLQSLAHFFAWTGYLWMGFAFLLFSLSLVFDCYRILAHLGAGFFSFEASCVVPPLRYVFMALLSLAAALTLYGYVDALHIRTERITILTPKVPEEVGSLRIVQISDLHLGLIVRERRLKRIVGEVRAAEPDVLVSTGDLIDGETNSMSGLDALLRDLTAPHGKFAVTGNHEFYAGLASSLAFTKGAGFTVLRGDTAEIGDFLVVAGVDDFTGRIYGTGEGRPEAELLSGLTEDRFVVLLKHQPVVIASSPASFDLQLSGHTHRGQIFPFTLITALAFPYNSGFYELNGGARLYVSRGTGTWGPPVRFLARPEITIIDLVHGKS